MGEAPASTPDLGDWFWAVVPAGGSGTRLWPLSRAARPKFLLPLLGKTSLLQDTIQRLSPITPPERTLIVCGPAHAAAIADQLPAIPAKNIVTEPSPKGSGPAIGLATAIIARQDPDAIMGSFAADHRVEHPDAFVSAVATAVEAAKQGWLVTIGLNPTRPETGYGYIERTDEPIGETGKAFRAARFVEKPDLVTATSYLESGRFLWNASMFIWRAQSLLDEMKRLQPMLHEGLQNIVSDWGTPRQEQTKDEIWPKLEDSTIDQGIMERADRVAVVPADLGWSDVGDWHGLGGLIKQDAAGNSFICDESQLITVDAQRSVVWSETNRLIALVGVEDIVIVDTPDALLIVRRDRAQDVKRIVETLKKAHDSKST